MFFLHVAPLILAKVCLYMNTFQNNLNIFCTSKGAKKRYLQLSRLKLSQFNRDLQIAMRN